jgi:hypothetical protein
LYDQYATPPMAATAATASSTTPALTPVGAAGAGVSVWKYVWTPPAGLSEKAGPGTDGGKKTGAGDSPG